MPRRDGTGPMGCGIPLGKNLGVCAGQGFGLGLGLGYGRGFGRNFVACSTDPRTNKRLLQEQKALLQSRIDAIDKQLEY